MVTETAFSNFHSENYQTKLASNQVFLSFLFPAAFHFLLLCTARRDLKYFTILLRFCRYRFLKFFTNSSAFLGECSPYQTSVSPDSSPTSITAARWKSLLWIPIATATSRTKGGSLLGKESSWTKLTANTCMSILQAWDSIGWRKGPRLTN